MEDMQRDFQNFADCYSNASESWDAQNYADALNQYPQELATLQSKYQLDLSKRKKTNGVDRDVTQMQATLDRYAKLLREKLEDGPEWIESMYASGQFKRPNTGPSTMQLLAQSLATVNQQLVQQNAQSQQQLNTLIQSIKLPTIKAPKIKKPLVNNSTLATPSIKTPVTNSTSAQTSVGNTGFDSVNVAAGAMDRLARCDLNAPSCEHRNFAGSVTTFNL